ncbi:hypothetical protein TNCV_3564761 [Trichonephila clavipes]|nr:hypothetical protein TNCV_3564761 [Trichonephila clavipes]
MCRVSQKIGTHGRVTGRKPLISTQSAKFVCSGIEKEYTGHLRIGNGYEVRNKKYAIFEPTLIKLLQSERVDMDRKSLNTKRHPFYGMNKIRKTPAAEAEFKKDGEKGVNRLEYIKLYCRNSNLGHHTGQANAVGGINADQIRCSQLASLDKNNALREIKLRLSYLQGKSTTMSVIAHQTEKEWISANEKSRQRMSQTQAEGAAKQHAARLEEAHLRAHHSCFTTSERC